MPHLVIAGGNGFLGRHIARSFSRDGWQVTALARGDAPVEGAAVVRWDGRSVGDWTRALDGADALLNLAGRSVNCRYDARHRAEILNSRLDSTRALGNAIARCARPPAVWLNSSTATIYRHAEDRPQDEATGEIGSGFSVDVATAWERAFFAAPVGIRRAALRTAMVMGRGAGGPFAVFRNLARFGLGGAMGPGTQRVSWLHVDDFIGAVRFLIERRDLDGAINLVAPDVPTNAEFMRTLRAAVRMPIGLPAPRPLLAIGAVVMRTETELPLKSRWAAPGRLRDAGFAFAHPMWSEAARALIAQ